MIADRYRLERKLGTGAAAMVFRCFDLELGRPVAVKVLEPKGPLADPARFGEEARVLARVKHPNVLQIMAFGVYEGRPYLVTEVAEGGSLADRILRGIPGEEVALDLARQTLEGLGAVHEAGIVHRDLKPGNVLLTREGTALISDFGLAKTKGSGVHTATGVILGTPEYMAPEVMLGEVATPMSDLYSWGCLLFALRTGRAPHGGTVSEMLDAKRKGAYGKVVNLGTAERAIRRALEPDPARRAGIPELLALLSGTAGPDLPGEADRGKLTVVSRPITPPSGRVPGRSASASASSSGSPLAATSSMSAVPATGPSHRNGIILGLVCTLGLAAAGVLGLRPGPGSPASDPGSSAQAGPPALDAAEVARRRSLVETWVDRLGAVDPGAILGPLHREVLPGLQGVPDFLNPYPKAMLDARSGQIPRSANLEALLARFESLPERQAFEDSRDELAQAATTREVSWELRSLLLSRIGGLRQIDAYWEAWNQDPPYRAARVIEAVHPGETRQANEVSIPGRVLPEKGLVTGGRYLVFSWTDELDRRYPWLFEPGDQYSDIEGIGLKALQGMTNGTYRLDRHREQKFAIRFPPETLERLASARLVLPISNLVVPYRLMVLWNGYPLAWYSDLSFGEHWDWRHPEKPDYVAMVGIPREAIRPGENRVELVPRPLSGLPRWTAVAVYWVGLDLEVPGT